MTEVIMEEQPLYEVTFGGDTTEDYNVSISTRIYRDNTAKHVLLLNTISTIEAVLIDRHFRRLKHEHGLTTVDFMTGGGKGMSFFLQYTDEATASAALHSFSRHVA